MNKPYISLSVIALIIAAGLTSCSSGKEEEKTAKAGPSGLTAGIHVVNEESLDNSIRTTGTLLANEEVLLKSEIPGKIVFIGFNEGDFVKQGQLLFRIDESELIPQKKKAEAQLSLAKKEFGRSKELLAIQAVSQEDYDNSANKMAELEAELSLLDARIKKSSVYAPFSGRAGLRYVSPGAFVSSGENLALIVQDNPMKVDFKIPEVFAGQVKTGQNIKFALSGMRDTFNAKVYSMEPKIDPQSRNLSVRAVLNNPGSKLIPGSFVQVILQLDLIKDALLVPAESIVPVINGQKVYVVKNGKAASRNVITGVRTSETVQVVEGLSIGDTILTTGILQVREGMNIIPAKGDQK